MVATSATATSATRYCRGLVFVDLWTLAGVCDRSPRVILTADARV